CKWLSRTVPGAIRASLVHCRICSTAAFIRWSSTSVLNGCDIRIPEGVKIRIRLFGHYDLRLGVRKRCNPNRIGFSGITPQPSYAEPFPIKANDQLDRAG